MKNSRNLFATSIVLIFCILFSSNLNAQCGTFTDSPRESEGLEAHVLYRDEVKLKKFDEAYDNWKKAYEIAPAADGKRPFHYTDGRKIYTHKLKNAATDDEKAEYTAAIIRLFDEQIQCYGKEGEEARLLGRKAFSMYYDLRSPYSETLSTLKDAVSKGGNQSEYIILQPYADIVVYQFTNEKMDKAEAREAHKVLNEIADHNIEAKGKYAAYYEQAKASMTASFAKIENFIFDCDYFVNKLRPDYEADPENPEVIESTIRTLKRRGCEESEPLLIELEGKWAKYAAEENAKRQAAFEKNNPGVMAKKLYDNGDYAGAIAKYKEAIDGTEDASQKASYWFSIASIQFRKMKSYSTARSSARKAAELKPGWGRPYMLIGDMYGSSARNCGDSWNQRLAILAAIDKYSYAKSIDSEVASEASSRISKYNASKPDQEEGFMRGVKAGQTVKCGCWIGESVKVRFK